MDKNQEITFQLLQEIDEICKENNITYYLHADTAAMALKEGGYISNYLSTAVEMTTQEAKKFMEYVEKNPKHGRVLEHMGNYSGYAGFSMRYVNTNTMYVPLNYYDNYQHKGIGIQILFIRGKISNKWKQKLWTALEFGMEQNEFFVRRNPEKREVIGKILVKIMQVFCKKDTIKRYFFEKWMKDYQYSGKGNATLRKAYGKKHEYPERYFDEIRYIKFEGREFPVIWDTEAHIRCWKGKNWRRNFKGISSGRELLIDSRVDFGEFSTYLANEGIYLEKLKNSHKILKKQILKRSKITKNKNQYWKYAWNVCKNYISDKKYTESKEYIYTLYECGAWMEVFDELAYYDAVMRENIKYGYHRSGDEKIAALYRNMLSMRDEKKLLEKLSRLGE